MLGINSKDLAILQALDQDVRASYTQIGRKTGLSKEVVQYRIKQLEKKGIITGYWTFPHIGTRNNIYKILIKNKSLGKAKKEEFIRFAKSQKVVSWLASTEGNWDFLITCFVTEDKEFSNFLISLMRKFGKYFKEKHILKSISATSLKEKYLYKENYPSDYQEDSFLETRPKLDHTDEEILRILSGNARSTFSEMGKALNLSPEAISVRFRRLLKDKYIKGMSPRVNLQKLGLSYYHLFISVSDYDKKDTICNFYIQHPNCIFIMKHIGYYDLHLEIVAKDEEIENIIEELTEKFGEAIASYELLKIRKEHLLVVTR